MFSAVGIVTSSYVNSPFTKLYLSSGSYVKSTSIAALEWFVTLISLPFADHSHLVSMSYSWVLAFQVFVPFTLYVNSISPHTTSALIVFEVLISSTYFAFTPISFLMSASSAAAANAAVLSVATSANAIVIEIVFFISEFSFFIIDYITYIFGVSPYPSHLPSSPIYRPSIMVFFAIKPFLSI